MKKKFINGDIVNDNKNELTINSCKLYIKLLVVSNHLFILNDILNQKQSVFLCHRD